MVSNIVPESLLIRNVMSCMVDELQVAGHSKECSTEN